MLADGRGGAIVNLASIASVIGLADRFVYGMSKTAVLGMTRAVAIDHVKQGIRCIFNCCLMARTTFKNKESLFHLWRYLNLLHAAAYSPGWEAAGADGEPPAPPLVSSFALIAFTLAVLLIVGWLLPSARLFASDYLDYVLWTEDRKAAERARIRRLILPDEALDFGDRSDPSAKRARDDLWRGFDGNGTRAGADRDGHERG